MKQGTEIAFSAKRNHEGSRAKKKGKLQKDRTKLTAFAPTRKVPLANAHPNYR